MTKLPPTTVSVGNGHFTVDAEALAPKLGLTVEALKEAMASGLVTSVAESGVDEDAGRTRLTFRYRARIWRVVVEADGTLLEDPAPITKPRTGKDAFSLLDLVRDAPRRSCP